MTTIPRGEAYSVLELPIGADADAIRTSYKRLAQKWHPEKNPKSTEAYQRFQKVNLAYKRLITDNEKVAMSMDQMYELYQQVMYPKYRHAVLDDDYDSSSDQDSCTTSDSDNDPLSTVLNYLGRSTNRKKCQQGHGDCESDNDQSLTPEQREQIANELITEEEKKKRQLEKRRLKKKQRREKKRLEKQSVENSKQNSSSKKSEKLKDHLPSSKVKKDKMENSQSHIKAEDNATATHGQTSKTKSENTAKLKEDENHASPIRTRELQNVSDDIDPVIVRSRQFAIQGNSMACSGQYQSAIECFSKAIQLDGSDFRFFGNRSYCFERLEQYDKALKDSNKAISLAPDWPKGYFRKGRALLGLKNYPAAEEAFMQVLKLDSKCEDARQELNRVRTCQLMEMGFSQQQAQNAVRQFDSVQQALDSLLAGLVSENPALDDVYISDEDETPVHPEQSTSSKVPGSVKAPASSKTVNSQPHAPVAKTANSHKKNEPLPPIPQSHYEEAARQIQMSRTSVPAALVDDKKMDPNNPEGLTSLWVGNVQPSVSQETLTEMFSRYGMLQSVRILPEKFCAFVNYVNKECAGRAMQGLQGTLCAGQQLLIKFPDNPITAAGGSADKPVKSFDSVKTVPVPLQTLSAKAPPVAASSTSSTTKLKGPVNGDECYFWRTTGCQFTNGCRYRHVPEHKGIDKKPWQRVSK